jgi:Cd2+/Zn2+-exporting ATPase
MPTESQDQKLELDIEVLLPHIAHERDQCIDKLEKDLANRRGITQAHLESKDNKFVLCLHYDPTLITLAGLQRTAQRSGANISSRYQHHLMPITGMDCSDCTLVIEHALKRMDGVIDASVSYVANTVRVEFDSKATTVAEIKARVKGLGYEIPETGLPAILRERRELIFSLLSGLSVLLAWLAPQLSLPTIVMYALFAAAYCFGGFDIARHALHSVKERHFDTDLLMIFAAAGAAVLGEYLEGGLLLFLFSLGHSLEELALDKARNAVAKLGQLTPKSAVVIRDTKQIEVSVDQVEIDELVVVKPGVRIPVDGIISHGDSSVDQSPITGESMPVEKTKGDQVFAGSINGNGQLVVKVTRLARDNTLSRVMQLVQESQTQKTRTQQVTEKFTAWFVPSVLIIDLLLIVIPPIFGVPIKTAFLRAMTFLVAVSPCALALAAPSAVLAGIAQAARNGVLIKGGLHLETLGQLKAMAFDKTGTLTHGKPNVTDLLVTSSLPENEILSLVAACESRSGHPLAAALVAEAQSRGLNIPDPESMDSVSGQGLVARVNGHQVLVGSLKLMQEKQVNVTDQQTQQLTTFEAAGKTVIAVSIDGSYSAIIALADIPRSDAKPTLAALHGLGIEKIFLLSGDNQRVAQKLANDLGIDEVKAQLMPEDKVSAMQKLAQDRAVAMVGDGVNDAPALAAASVGIAMGGASTDVALETADVALMGDDLAKLPFAVSLGRATRAVVRQNLTVSILTIVFLAAAAVFGIANIGIAIVFHEGSTILVVLNSLRLLAHRSGLSHASPSPA